MFDFNPLPFNTVVIAKVRILDEADRHQDVARRQDRGLVVDNCEGACGPTITWERTGRTYDCEEGVEFEIQRLN